MRHRVFVDVDRHTGVVTALRLDDADAGSRVRVTIADLGGDLILDLPADLVDELVDELLEAVLR